MTFVIPTQGNVVVKSVEASGKLFVDYARDLKNWAINKYVQIAPVKKTSGLYTRMTIEEAGRILYPDGRNFEWYDSSPAPTGPTAWNRSNWSRSGRSAGLRHPPRRPDDRHGRLAPALEQNMRIKAQQAMTMRTQLAVTALTTSTNYANYSGDTSHVIDVTQIAGASGSWADSTTARGDIQRSLETACEQILDDTLNGVNLDDLVPGDLLGLGRGTDTEPGNQGLHQGGPGRLGPGPRRTARRKRPLRPAGQAVRRACGRRGHPQGDEQEAPTRAVSQVLSGSTPFIVARPGSLESTATGPNFSTCVLFAHEEMTVEQIRVPIDRLTYGRVVENLAAYVVAPASGVLFQNAM